MNIFQAPSAMFSCRACVAFRDRDTDTVRVNVDNIESREVIERWDAGEGRFVELREGDRLVVGAPTVEIADQLVEAWRERRDRKQVYLLSVDEDCGFEKAQAAKAAREEEEQRQREEKELAEERERQAELDRQKEEEARLRREAKIQERKQRVEDFLKTHQFTDVKTPKRVQEKVLGLPLMSKSVYAIHVAAELGDAAMVEMLIKEGADVSSKTSSGKTAAELAKKKGKSGSHDGVLTALNQRTAKIGGA